MRTPSKARETLSKVLPLRWSFGSKSRRKPAPGPEPADAATAATTATSVPAAPAELVEYLESGRRPRCTKEPIVALMGPSASKEAPQGQQRSTHGLTSSSSSLSCLERAPEGQHRPGAETTGTLRRSNTNVSKQQQQQQQQLQLQQQQREDGTATLGRRSTRKGKQEQGRPHDSQSRRGSNTGVVPSTSTHAASDSGREPRGKGGTTEEETDEDKGRRGEESKTHDSLFSFLKGGFLKKDSMRRSRDSEWGRGSEAGSRSLSKLSLSNGGPVEGRGSNSASTRGRHGEELTNGKVVRASMPDIKRSQSSSNIQTRGDLSLRRTASLHRNGLSVVPAARGSLGTDKASCGTLQRSRYSSTSLGRKRTVPESSF